MDNFVEFLPIEEAMLTTAKSVDIRLRKPADDVLITPAKIDAAVEQTSTYLMLLGRASGRENGARELWQLSTRRPSDWRTDRRLLQSGPT